MNEDGKAAREDGSDQRQQTLMDRAQQLETEGRFLEAATLIAAALPAGTGEVPKAQLPLGRRGVGLFFRAGDMRSAAQLLVRFPIDLALLVADETGQAVCLAAAALAESRGRPELAFRLRSWLGHHSAAARLARQMGRHFEAGELFLKADMPVEASQSFSQGGDRRRAIEALSSVQPAEASYRAACIAAIRLAHEEGAITFAIDRFLSEFVEKGPHDATELDALTLLANLYVRQGLQDNAYRVAHLLLAADPGHPIATQIRANLDTAPAADDGLPLLPDLPPAPRLPDPEELLPTPGRMPIAGVFSVGTLVEGRYLLEERIGRGGTSAIFRALDTILGDHIALKAFLLAVPDEKADRRIRRELRMARELTHPNIVRVHDLGSQQGFRYITMELLEGTDLRTKISAGLAMNRGLDYLIQICEGLGAAHAKGIVHRDIKPENCFVTGSEIVKLLDFGIAKVVSAPGATASGAILGTLAYISPEQISDYSGVTHKADLYSLGIVAYEMFAHRTPFGPSDPMTVIRMHMEQAPTPPREHEASIPPALEKTILRLLEKDPSKRHESCFELKDELTLIRPLLI